MTAKNSNTPHKWMSSGYLQAAPKGEVSEEKGIIEGVSVCSVGEAKGHGVHLDSEFISTVAELGGDKRQGLKARFGHPNMCSTALGTFLGRFKNFREAKTLRDGKEVEAVVADLFVSNEAKNTPHGDLYSYVLGMAKNEPDMFGTSIVFTPGKVYRRDLDTGEKVYGSEFDADDRELSEEMFVECEALHACDAVDDPAANDGLFSGFSRETFAGQITEFLDLHPQVFQAIVENPEILDALSRYGNKVDEFINRYTVYRQQRKEETMTEETTSSEKLEAGAVEEPSATATPETEEKLEEEKVEAKEEESTAEPEQPAEEKTAEEPKEEEAGEPEKEEEEKKEEEEAPVEAEAADEADDSLERSEFLRIVEAFGADIAVQTVRDNGNFETAQALHAAKVVEENEQLKQRLEELEQSKSGTPAVVTEAPAKSKGKLFNTGK